MLVAALAAAAALATSPQPATIAVVDTGVAPLAAFAGRVVPGANVVGGTSTADPNGHGTALASVAAGMCPVCAVMPVVAIDPTGTGSSDAEAAGVTWAAAHGARVILVAVTANADAPALDQAIAAATAAGATVVIAAGNSGSSDPSQGGYPAASSPEAVTVAALRHGVLAPWSNHGSWVDIAAPGRRVTVGATDAQLVARGTSVAAAYVAGVVGAMLTANPSLTPAAVQQILLLAGTPAGLDVQSGRALDVAAALRLAAAAG